MHSPLVLVLALFVLAATGCASRGAASNRTPQPLPPGDVGATPANAIEVCMPDGQRAYLARLVCPGGEHAAFRRIGSVGERTKLPDDMNPQEQERILEQILSRRPLRDGETDYHMVDGYEVACPDRTVLVHLDMYHCDAPRPRTAPSGFTLID